MKLKIIYTLFIILIGFFIFNVNAERGCCSWHGGVCGNSCCDGTPLSSKCGGGNTYYYYNYEKCPANSYKTDLGCKCNFGYKSNILKNKCEPDQNLHCYIKFPGTIRDSSLNMCICPEGNPLGRNPEKRGCPVTDNQCKEEFGIGSIAMDFDHCACGTGYKRDDNIQMNKCIENINNKYNEEKYKEKKSSGKGIRIFILLFFGFITRIKLMRD